MKYYKILKDNPCLSGMEYKEGLIEDIWPFNSNGLGERGLYFASVDILGKLNDGTKIADVEIPNGVEVVEENKYKITTFKSNSIILKNIRVINLEVIKENDYIL